MCICWAVPSFLNLPHLCALLMAHLFPFKTWSCLRNYAVRKVTHAIAAPSFDSGKLGTGCWPVQTSGMWCSLLLPDGATGWTGVLWAWYWGSSTFSCNVLRWWAPDSPFPSTPGSIEHENWFGHALIYAVSNFILSSPFVSFNFVNKLLKDTGRYW